MDPAAPTLDELLTHSAWVRALARQLVRDPHLADDLAQDAYLAALTGAPPRRSARSWLAAVLRNRLRERARADERRRGRERAAARGTPAAPTADVVERAQTHATVVSAVLALRAPTREVVLMRFFDDLPPREIAARLDVPVSTVHTRLTRGFERLRADLRSRLGGDGSWQRSLAALAVPAAAAPGAGLSAVGIAGAATVALLIGGGLAWWVGSGRLDSTPEPPPRRTPVVVEEDGDERAGPPSAPPAARGGAPDRAPVEDVAGSFDDSSRRPAVSPSRPDVADRSEDRTVLAGAAPPGGAPAPHGMVRVPVGTFSVGLDPADVQAVVMEEAITNPAIVALFAASVPRHDLELDAFWIDVREVTHHEWALYLDATGRPPNAELVDGAWHGETCPEELLDRPVTLVSVAEAEAYARWAGKRLPTEHEWTRAACGDAPRVFPWGDAFDDPSLRVRGGDRAWCADSTFPGRRMPQPGGTRPLGRSPFGVDDLAGNVWEWTASPYLPYPGHEEVWIRTRDQYAQQRVSAAAFFDPARRVIKGGAFDTPVLALRTDVRQFEWGKARNASIGFRCVRSDAQGVDAIAFALGDVGADRFPADAAPLGAPVAAAVTDADDEGRVLGHREVALAPVRAWPRLSGVAAAREEAARAPLPIALLALDVPSLGPRLAPGAYVVTWSPAEGRADRVVLLDAEEMAAASWPVEAAPRRGTSPSSATLERSADGDRERLRFAFEVGAGPEVLPFELDLSVAVDALRNG